MWSYPNIVLQQRVKSLFDVLRSELGYYINELSYSYTVSESTMSVTCLLVQGKENGVNILKLINKGPFQMGTFRETLSKEKDRYNANIQATNILLQGLPKDIYSLISHYTDAKDIWDNVKMLLEGLKLTKEDRESHLVGYANPGQARKIKCYNFNGIGHIVRNCTQPKWPQNSEYFKDKMLLMQAQENKVALDEEQLLFITGGKDNVVDDDVDEQPIQDLALNVDNVFQDDDYDAFDSDVDEAPTAQTMFMANLSSVDLVYDEVGPSYDSNILSEYVNDNAMPVIQNSVSSAPNDAYMMIFNDMHEQPAQYISGTKQNTVVDNSLTAKLAIYKDQVELYKRQTRFELMEREQKIDEQLRIVITDQEVTSLKKDFKQKENKYVKDFLDMRALKEKVNDRLFKQDQTLQTVHMLCKSKPHYDEQRKIAIGYKNPFYLSKANQVQPALYSGQKIVKPNHARVLVHDLEDTLEIAENTRKQMNKKMKDLECVKKKYLIKMKAKALKEQTPALRPIKALTVGNPRDTEFTRKKMNEKMNDPEYVKKKVKISLYDYSKDNYLATFTPQKQLTHEQIFWSKDLIKMKLEALKEQTTVSRPMKALTMYPLNTPIMLVLGMLSTKMSRFSNMHEALNATEKRITELESENSNLQNKIQNDDHDVMVNHFSKLEVEHLNVQLKYQHLKESFENEKSMTSSDAPTFDSVCVIGQLKDQIQSRGNTICELRDKIYRLTMKHSEAVLTHDSTTLDSQTKELHAKINALHNLNERWWAENETAKRHYKELYYLIKITRAKNIETINSLLTEVANLKAQLTTHHKSNCVTMPAVKSKVHAQGRYAIDMEPIPLRIRNNREAHLDYVKHIKESVETLREIVKEANVERPLDKSLASSYLYTKHSQELLEYTMHKTNKPTIPSTGVNSATTASGSKPRSNTKKDMTLQAKSDMQKVEVHPRKNKSSVKQKNHVVQIVFWYLDSSCSKHMTGDRSRLRNFVKKFIGTVRFGNDHFGAIMGYGYYVIGDSVNSRVYYMEGLGHNLFSVGQFCDFHLEVAFGEHSCYVCDTDSVELIKGLDILFQPMFDEYLEPLHVERPVSPAPVVPAPLNSADTPLSTSIDQDAPFTSHLPSSSTLQSPCLHQGIAAESTLMDENPFALVYNDPFINIFALEPSSATSSSEDDSSANSTYV
nr:retrovirus-related Pol polyprotein from transposon TNT 1-94 [Tanacetum cinerariifolium]